MRNSLWRSAISLDTWKPTSNILKPNPATSAEKNSAVLIIRNATRNPTTTQLPVPFVVNFVIEGKTCSVTERPEVRPWMLVQRPASPEHGPSISPAKRRRIHSPHSFNSPSIELNILPEDPEIRILYLRHWHTIQTQANNGNRVQDRYNLTLNDITLLHFSRDGTQYFHTTNVAFQSQCLIRFYFEKRRNWRITFFSMFHI